MNYDRRQSLLQKEERKKSIICQIFHISRNTLDLWLKRKKETGDLAAINNESEGKKLKIKDQDKFEQFVLRHNYKTQIQIAELWGDNLTQQNVSKACQKLIGYNQKKKLTVMKKEMKWKDKNLWKNY